MSFPRWFASVAFVIVLFIHPWAMSQAPQDDDETVDIQVNSQDELVARQQAEALNNRGYELLEAGQYAEAEQLFRRSLRLDSTSQSYFENLARSLGGQQKIKQVVEVYTRAQRQFPQVADLYYYRGDALQKLQQYDAARKDYTKALALADENPDTQLRHLYYFNRGNTYLKQRDYAAARQDYDRALQINEFHFASYANRGFARFNLKDKPGACDDWHRALEAGYEAAQQYLTKYCQ